MKVLWLSHIVPYPPKGGSLQRSFNLVRELASRHEVHLLAFNQRALLPTPETVLESEQALAAICRTVEIVEARSELSRVWRYGILLGNLLSSRPYSVDLLRSSEMHRKVVQLLQRIRIDLIHLDTVELAPLVPDSYTGAVVLNHHNVESQLLARRARVTGNPLARGYLRLQAAKLRRYESRVASRVQLNLVVSEPDRLELLAHCPKARVEVIQNGVDVEYFRPQAGPVSEAELIFAGGMTWFPNRDAVAYFLASIWPLVKQRRPTARLTLIGRRPEVIAELTSDPQVSVLGFVDDVRPYMARATVVIIPLRVGGGTRLKILDAFACGKAVVSTRIGCEGLDVTHGREILVADTPEAFAGEVLRVCDDAARREGLGRRARELVEERYSWSSIGQELNRQYEKLASAEG